MVKNINRVCIKGNKLGHISPTSINEDKEEYDILIIEKGDTIIDKEEKYLNFEGTG